LFDNIAWKLEISQFGQLIRTEHLIQEMVQEVGVWFNTNEKKELQVELHYFSTLIIFLI
jgi:hypothetical protein